MGIRLVAGRGFHLPHPLSADRRCRPGAGSVFFRRRPRPRGAGGRRLRTFVDGDHLRDARRIHAGLDHSRHDSPDLVVRPLSLCGARPTSGANPADKKLGLAPALVGRGDGLRPLDRAPAGRVARAAAALSRHCREHRLAAAERISLVVGRGRAARVDADRRIDFDRAALAGRARASLFATAQRLGHNGRPVSAVAAASQGIALQGGGQGGSNKSRQGITGVPLDRGGIFARGGMVGSGLSRGGRRTAADLRRTSAGAGLVADFAAALRRPWSAAGESFARRRAIEPRVPACRGHPADVGVDGSVVLLRSTARAGRGADSGLVLFDDVGSVERAPLHDLSARPVDARGAQRGGGGGRSRNDHRGGGGRRRAFGRRPGRRACWRAWRN